MVPGLPFHKNKVLLLNVMVMGKMVAAPGNYVTTWRCTRKLNSFARSCNLAAQVCARSSTSAARFFAVAAGESLLVLVSLSLSGVSLRLSWLLA